MAFSAFVFDLDGTLLDTLDDLASACNTMLTRHNWPAHPTKQYRSFVGNGFTMLVKRALPQNVVASLSEEEFLALVQEGKGLYHDNLIGVTKPYLGISELITQLQQKQCRLGVLSNKPDEETKILIEHFFPQTFHVVHGGRENVPLKPNPSALLAMLDELGCRKEELAYVGDSNVDMQTALNADVFSIGVAWGFRGADELKNAGACAVASKASDILALTK